MLSPNHLSENIPIDKFLEVLGRYPATLKAVSDSKTKKRPIAGASTSKTTPDDDTLVGLDEWKNNLRGKITDRSGKKSSKAKGGAYITKEELQHILQWKLKRGVFRPLAGKVASNTSELVESTTRKFFEAFPVDQSPVTCDPAKEEDDDAKVKKMLDILTVPLRGVGPATATAITSSLFPAEMPFFSDEAYRWIMWSSQAKKGSGSGWDRKIDYKIQEYYDYCHGVWNVVSRLRNQAEKQQLDITIGAAEVERVGWTLGQQYKLGEKFSEVPVKKEDRVSTTPVTKAIKTEEPTNTTGKTTVLKVEDTKPAIKSKAPHTEEEKNTAEPSDLRRSKRTKR